jgi:hypothetical protein
LESVKSNLTKGDINIVLGSSSFSLKGNFSYIENNVLHYNFEFKSAKDFSAGNGFARFTYANKKIDPMVNNNSMMNAGIVIYNGSETHLAYFKNIDNTSWLCNSVKIPTDSEIYVIGSFVCN